MAGSTDVANVTNKSVLRADNIDGQAVDVLA